MRLLIVILILLLPYLTACAEIDSDFRISLVENVNHTAIGINGTIFPPHLTKNRFSLGADLGMQLIERFLHDRTDSQLDTVDNPYGSDDDYVIWFNKNYRDYMFLLTGVQLRYDLRDPGKLNKIRPAVFIGAGAILNIYQESARQIQDWYDDYPYDPSEPLLFRYALDSGGKSIATVDLYVKSKVALYYNRLYFSYEYYLGSKFIRHSFCFGYVFRL